MTLDSVPLPSPGGDAAGAGRSLALGSTPPPSSGARSFAYGELSSTGAPRFWLGGL